jgi:Tfp pilus assembly protein PilP
MKQTIFFLILFLTLSGFNNTESVSLKTFTEEAMSKSLIGNDPIIVANPFSAKIYSKLDLRHPVWNNLKREELVVIPKNSDLLEKLWGKQAKENGVIVYRAAQENKYDLKKLRYVLNGKEINKIDADTLNIKDVNSFIIVKDRNSEERVAFINSQK